MSSDVADYVPLSTPAIGGNEWTYVKECLDTSWVSTVGPFVDRFEKEFAAYLGIPHAVACQSGTAALHVALQVGGVVAGDEVLVPALTFIAPANAATYLGAVPVLVDVDPVSGLMDLELVERFLRTDCEKRDGRTYNKKSGARVACVLPVHVLGHMVDMQRLMALAAEFSLIVVEDATESLGSSYGGQAAGAIGHLGCFSFNGNKIMTTGGGGMIVSTNAAWARRAKHLTNQAKLDPVEYEHDEIGYNYRLTNVQAAMGVAQLERLDAFLEAKQTIARRYVDGFKGMNGITPISAPEGCHSNWWLFTILVEPDGYGIDSRALMHALAMRGIQSRPLWRPLHLGPHASRRLLGSGRSAERFYRLALSLPCSTHLTAAAQDRVIDAVRDAGRA